MGIFSLILPSFSNSEPSMGSRTISRPLTFFGTGPIRNVVLDSCRSTTAFSNLFSISFLFCMMGAAFAGVGAIIAFPDGTFHKYDISVLSGTSFCIVWRSWNGLTFCASWFGSNLMITLRSFLLCPQGGVPLSACFFKGRYNCLVLYACSFRSPSTRWKAWLTILGIWYA